MTHKAISNDFWPPKLMKGDVEHKPVLVTWQRWFQSHDVTDVISHTIIKFAAQILVPKNNQWFDSSHKAYFMCPDSPNSSEYWDLNIVSFWGSKPQPWLSHQKLWAITSVLADSISAWLDRLATFKLSRGNTSTSSHAHFWHVFHTAQNVHSLERFCCHWFFQYKW